MVLSETLEIENLISQIEKSLYSGEARQKAWYMRSTLLIPTNEESTRQACGASRVHAVTQHTRHANTRACVHSSALKRFFFEPFLSCVSSVPFPALSSPCCPRRIYSSRWRWRSCRSSLLRPWFPTGSCTRSAVELGLVPAQEEKSRRITEGLSGADTLIAASIGISSGCSIGSGIGELIDGGVTCMQTDVAGTASQTVVHKSATGVLDSVAIQVMDSAVSASQLHPTTHSQDTITHQLPPLPPSSSSSPSQPSPSTDPSPQPWPAFSPNSTPLSPNFTNLSQFPVSGAQF